MSLELLIDFLSVRETNATIHAFSEKNVFKLMEMLMKVDVFSVHLESSLSMGPAQEDAMLIKSISIEFVYATLDSSEKVETA